MKKSLSIGALVLGCCLAAAAQMGSTPNQTAPASTTPSTFPQDQTGQTQANPATPTNPSAMPPDTSAAPTADQSSQAGNSQTSVQGCLSRGSDGSFTVADNSGTSYQLRGDSSQLGDFEGTMVAVDGTITSSSSAGAMASPTSSDSPGSPSAGRQLSVSHVRKISDSCATSATTTN